MVDFDYQRLIEEEKGKKKRKRRRGGEHVPHAIFACASPTHPRRTRVVRKPSLPSPLAGDFYPRAR
ncbi:hypothetical protein B296_00053423, partial [Ensete ventricosum]